MSMILTSLSLEANSVAISTTLAACKRKAISSLNAAYFWSEGRKKADVNGDSVNRLTPEAP